MIKIIIGFKDNKLLDSFDKKDTNLKEVSAVLLRLKQIEHQLINLEFESEFEIEKEEQEEEE